MLVIVTSSPIRAGRNISIENTITITNAPSATWRENARYGYGYVYRIFIVRTSGTQVPARGVRGHGPRARARPLDQARQQHRADGHDRHGVREGRAWEADAYARIGEFAYAYAWHKMGSCMVQSMRRAAPSIHSSLQLTCIVIMYGTCVRSTPYVSPHLLPASLAARTAYVPTCRI